MTRCFTGMKKSNIVNRITKKNYITTFIDSEKNQQIKYSIYLWHKYLRNLVYKGTFLIWWNWHIKKNYGTHHSYNEMLKLSLWVQKRGKHSHCHHFYGPFYDPLVKEPVFEDGTNVQNIWTSTSITCYPSGQ